MSSIVSVDIELLNLYYLNEWVSNFQSLNNLLIKKWLENGLFLNEYNLRNVYHLVHYSHFYLGIVHDPTQCITNA